MNSPPTAAPTWDHLPAAAVAAVFGLLLAGCEASTERLDEFVFHDGPRFKLKVVRYYERYPLHFDGEVFTVQCSSLRTGNAGHPRQDAGWVALGGGAAIGSKDAKEVAGRESGNYRALGDEILVWLGNGLNVSFDACGTFRAWYPTALPAELIAPLDKPDYCAPKGRLDCRNYDFEGERAPRFEAVWADAGGTVSFLVRSKAFKGDGALRVRSDDYGKTWTFTTAGQP